MARLRSDLFVAALMRQAEAAGANACLLRRGAPEAGAIFVLVDRLDGTVTLHAPAPDPAGEAGERRFAPLPAITTFAEARDRLEREARIDPDLFVVAIDDREGRAFVDAAGA